MSSSKLVPALIAAMCGVVGGENHDCTLSSLGIPSNLHLGYYTFQPVLAGEVAEKQKASQRYVYVYLVALLSRLIADQSLGQVHRLP